MNEEQDRYLIPKDLRSQIKFGYFTFLDIVVVISTLLFWYVLIAYLELGFIMNVILFFLFAFTGLFLIMRTSGNPDRPRISVMYSALFNQDDRNYRSLDYNEYVKRKDVE